MSKPAYCDGCGDHIPPVFKRNPEISVDGEALSSEAGNLEGAMIIGLHGSYGEYYDFMGVPRPIILCEVCGNRVHDLFTQMGIDPRKLVLAITLGEQFAKPFVDSDE